MSKIEEIRKLRELGVPMKGAHELVERHGSAEAAIKASNELRARFYAPELLEALRVMVEGYRPLLSRAFGDDAEATDPYLRQARAAIAKAKGD